MRNLPRKNSRGLPRDVFHASFVSYGLLLLVLGIGGRTARKAGGHTEISYELLLLGLGKSVSDPSCHWPSVPPVSVWPIDSSRFRRSWMRSFGMAQQKSKLLRRKPSRGFKATTRRLRVRAEEAQLKQQKLPFTNA